MSPFSSGLVHILKAIVETHIIGMFCRSKLADGTELDEHLNSSFDLSNGNNMVRNFELVHLQYEKWYVICNFIISSSCQTASIDAKLRLFCEKHCVIFFITATTFCYSYSLVAALEISSGVEC